MTSLSDHDPKNNGLGSVHHRTLQPLGWLNSKTLNGSKAERCQQSIIDWCIRYSLMKELSRSSACGLITSRHALFGGQLESNSMGIQLFYRCSSMKVLGLSSSLQMIH